MLFKKRTTVKTEWERGIGLLQNDVTMKSTEGAFIEKRRAPRVALSVPVHFQLKGMAKNWESAESVDISKYGIRISTLSQKIQAGNKIELKVKLPEVESPFQLKGIVVWVKPIESAIPTVECGVSFEDPKRISHLGKVLSFLTDKLCTFALERSKNLTVRAVESMEELKQMFRLVYEQYLVRGYCGKDSSEMYCTYFCFLPESQTFFLREKDRLLGTVTLIPDSPCGLPMEAIFPDEVESFRKPGRKLAEVSLLALDLKAFEKRSFVLTDFEKLSSSFKLFKAMFDYARSVAGVTDLMITMHPKHQGLYQYLKFETIGVVRSYSRACGKPALPMHLDMERAVKEVSQDEGVGSYFLKISTPPELWKRRHQWNIDSAREILKSIPSLKSKIPGEHLRHIERIYPGIFT